MPKSLFVDPSVVRAPGEVTFNTIPVNQYNKTIKEELESGKYTKVATVSETTWADSPTAGKTYYYKVKAVCGKTTDGNSIQSAAKSIRCKCAKPTAN